MAGRGNHAFCRADGGRFQGLAVSRQLQETHALPAVPGDFQPDRSGKGLAGKDEIVVRRVFKGRLEHALGQNRGVALCIFGDESRLSGAGRLGQEEPHGQKMIGLLQHGHVLGEGFPQGRETADQIVGRNARPQVRATAADAHRECRLVPPAGSGSRPAFDRPPRDRKRARPDISARQTAKAGIACRRGRS